jgi:hypothetical protein
MCMRVRKFLQSDYGKIIMSILLGFGLSTLFRKTCTGKKCMEFKGPDLHKIVGQPYKYDNSCYTFTPNAVKCNSQKKIVRFA